MRVHLVRLHHPKFIFLAIKGEYSFGFVVWNVLFWYIRLFCFLDKILFRGCISWIVVVPLGLFFTILLGIFFGLMCTCAGLGFFVHFCLLF